MKTKIKMKTMKIINLLQLIASKNYNKLPTKFVYNGNTYIISDFNNAFDPYYFSYDNANVIFLEEIRSARQLNEYIRYVDNSKDENVDIPIEEAIQISDKLDNIIRALISIASELDRVYFR